MRRTLLTSLVLLPVLAHAQARTATEPQPSTSSANFVAELTAPAAPKVSASVATMNTASHAAIREFVQTRMTDNFTDAALRMGGTLEFSMKGSLPMASSAPQVTRAVEIGLSPQELSEEPAESKVVLHAVVDEYGIPRNVFVTESAGKVVDKKAVAAVSQYRFKPAMVDNQATWAAVSISITIKK